MEKQIKSKMLNIRLDSNISEEFKNYCKKNGYSISKRIRVLIRKELNKIA